MYPPQPCYSSALAQLLPVKLPSSPRCRLFWGGTGEGLGGTPRGDRDWGAGPGGERWVLRVCPATGESSELLSLIA